MDTKTKSILLGGIALLILAVTFGVIFYLGKASRNQNVRTEPSLDSLSQLPSLSTSDNSSGTGNNNTGTTKSFTGEGFTLKYPTSWGLLTCSNSQNFELDPTSSQDIKGVVCDMAVKPVTFLISSTRAACQGETVTLGSNQVVKSKITARGDTNYRWCLMVGSKSFDVTHRVSPSGSRATSKDDFSSQIEEVIKSLQTTPAGS
ncbi:MAG: hypothetical protein Q7S44_01735 [bacterium]|nr:hypothetical protein [bacterium]